MIVQEVERHAPHPFESRTVYRRIKMRIDSRLGDSEVIIFPEDGLRNQLLNFFFGHSQTKTHQLVRGRQVSEFLRTLAVCVDGADACQNNKNAKQKDRFQ